MCGRLGPYTSASIKPTRAPNDFSPKARLHESVLLPTPPLPLPTATTFLIRKPAAPPAFFPLTFDENATLMRLSWGISLRSEVSRAEEIRSRAG